MQGVLYLDGSREGITDAVSVSRRGRVESEEPMKEEAKPETQKRNQHQRSPGEARARGGRQVAALRRILQDEHVGDVIESAAGQEKGLSGAALLRAIAKAQKGESAAGDGEVDAGSLWVELSLKTDDTISREMISQIRDGTLVGSAPRALSRQTTIPKPLPMPAKGRPNLKLVKKLFSALFDDVAEAFVLLDVNGGGPSINGLGTHITPRILNPKS
jgi:hypothetical protein